MNCLFPIYIYIYIEKKRKGKEKEKEKKKKTFIGLPCGGCSGRIHMKARFLIKKILFHMNKLVLKSYSIPIALSFMNVRG